MKKLISLTIAALLVGAVAHGAGIEIPANVVTRLGVAEAVGGSNNVAITAEVARATAAEDVNTAAIVSNDTDIAANVTDIAINLAAIASNDTDIAANTAAIVSNDTDIAANTAAIVSNDTDIAANTAAIVSNDTDIAANTAAIVSNDTDIAANTANLTNETIAIAGAAGSKFDDRYPLLGPDATTSLMVQHGTNTLSSGTYAFTFDPPFATTPITVLVQYTADPGSPTNRCYTASVTTNGFTATGDSDVEVGFIAVGAK